MSHHQNITTLLIPDPNGGQPQMIKVVAGGKIPIHLTTRTVGGAPTIKRIIKTTTGDMGSIFHDGKFQNRQIIALPTKQTITVPGIRGPLVVPMSNVQIKSSATSHIEQTATSLIANRTRPPTISSPLVICSQTGAITVPSISTSIAVQHQSKVVGSTPMLQAQLKHISQQQTITLKPQTVHIHKPSEVTVRAQNINREQAKPVSKPVYQELFPGSHNQNEQNQNRHIPQSSPGSPTKSLMNTSILDHSGTRKRHDFDFDYSVAGKRRKTEKGGKGLRHFSMKVCEKVKAKGTTSYNEVADELVTEFTESNRSSSPLEVINYDQKNIRRRVYDALNVLMAMNIISKEKKEIRWLGLPTNSAQECHKLEGERKKVIQRIKLKTQQLQDLILQQIAFKNLVERNRKMEREIGAPSPNSAIQLPFIIVNTSKQTVIDCSISNDKTEYLFNFDNTFEIHDDIEVLKKMGMSLGLEKGQCSLQDLEKAKKLVPKALEDYVTELAKKSVSKTELKPEVDYISNSLLMDFEEVEVDSSVYARGSSKEERGRLSRHSSLGSLNHDLRTESGSPSSFADFDDQDSDLEVS